MIQDGKITAEGDPDEVAEKYEDINIEAADNRKTAKMLNKEIDSRSSKIITKIKLANSQGKESQIFSEGEDATLTVDLKPNSEAKNIGVAIYDKAGHYIFGTNTINDKHKISNKINYTFKLNLGEGDYRLKIGVFGKDDKTIYEFFENGPAFIIKSENQTKDGWQGVVKLPHSWS